MAVAPRTDERHHVDVHSDASISGRNLQASVGNSSPARLRLCWFSRNQQNGADQEKNPRADVLQENVRRNRLSCSKNVALRYKLDLDVCFLERFLKPLEHHDQRAEVHLVDLLIRGFS